MADTPFPRLSRASFEVVQTWLHRRGAAIEAALACPVLQDQKADFAELLIAEGVCCIVLNARLISTVPLASDLRVHRGLS
jgi:hypothetical protein